MHGLAAVRRQSGIVDFEAELVEVVGDQDRVGLLLVDAEREGLDAAEEQEGIERRETIPDRVDREADALRITRVHSVFTPLANAHERLVRTLAMSSRSQQMRPAMRSWCPLRYLVPES